MGTCDFVMGFVDFGEVALAQKVREFENVVLDLLAGWDLGWIQGGSGVG